MLEIIKEIYNKPRTLISPATRETLRYIKSKVGGMKILYFKSGTGHTGHFPSYVMIRRQVNYLHQNIY